MKKRIAVIPRKTKETDIKVKLNIDGSGKAKIDTGIGLLDHMLELFAFHGLFDLDIVAKGDLKVDIHHTNEDVGIVLGDAFKKALGNKEGIKRFGSASVPMEEVVANVTVDISGRGLFRFITQPMKPMPFDTEGYAFNDLEHFLESFATHLGMNLNISTNLLSTDLHTTLEPIFKA
ncbi:MAG: imidazoleglycerol-phosphate dehydratase, partial [Candidatus Omnitrophica bacterium]|nr:imidazoleglycerol-phosphate dehydratase [Candidatus Omnitrophota bacterium]